jgi:N-acetylneuraminic acid mutarotase
MVRWLSRIEGGEKRVNPAVVHITDTPLVVSFGGFCNEFDRFQYMDARAFNVATLQWTLLTPARRPPGHEGQSNLYLPKKRSRHTATALGHEVYVIGGIEQRTLDVFNMTRKTWKQLGGRACPLTDRSGHTATVIGGLIYVFGGYGRSHGEKHHCLNSIEIFDPRAECWTRPDVTADVPVPRDNHAAAAIDDFMFVFGGRGERDHFLNLVKGLCGQSAKDHYLSMLQGLDPNFLRKMPFYPNELSKFDVKNRQLAYCSSVMWKCPCWQKESFNGVVEKKTVHFWGSGHEPF